MQFIYNERDKHNKVPNLSYEYEKCDEKTSKTIILIYGIKTRDVIIIEVKIIYSRP